MTAYGLSQHALVKDHGIGKAQLQRLRKNMVVKTITLDRLCKIFDCPLEAITEYVPDEE